MKIRRIVRFGFRGIPLIPIAIMAVTVAAAVLAASTQIVSTVTIQTFQMQADTVSGTSCTTTPLTSINYGTVPSGAPLPNTNFCLTNSSPSAIYTGGGTITVPTFAITGSLPSGVTEDWIIAASSNTGCVGMSIASQLTITATPGSNTWTVSGGSLGNPGGCVAGNTISYFTLSHTGSSSTPGTYTWTSTL